jgi:hypothetical protein
VDAWSPALKVVLGTIAFAAGTILLLSVSALLFARDIQWKMCNVPTVHRQLIELSKERPGAASRWLGRRMILSGVTIALLIFTVLSRRWYLFSLILVLLPFSLVVHGLEVVDLQYKVVSLPLQPMRLLTGDAAVRYGRILLVVGLILSVLCVVLAISGGLATIFLSGHLTG